MTCCIGIESGDSVWLGWDSATTDDSMWQAITRDQKGWTVNGWGFAFAGSWRCGQLLNHELAPKRIRRNQVARYVVVDLVNEIRSILRAEPEKQVKPCEMLVAHRGRLFLGELNTYQFTEATCGYAAVGTADAYTGLALTKQWRNQRTRITSILTAVAEHSANVRPPFTVIRV